MSIAELGGHLQELKSAFMDDQLVNEDEYKGLIEAVRDSFRKEPVVPEVAPMRWWAALLLRFCCRFCCRFSMPVEVAELCETNSCWQKRLPWFAVAMSSSLQPFTPISLIQIAVSYSQLLTLVLLSWFSWGASNQQQRILLKLIGVGRGSPASAASPLGNPNHRMDMSAELPKDLGGLDNKL